MSTRLPSAVCRRQRQRDRCQFEQLAKALLACLERLRGGLRSRHVPQDGHQLKAVRCRVVQRGAERHLGREGLAVLPLVQPQKALRLSFAGAHDVVAHTNGRCLSVRLLRRRQCRRVHAHEFGHRAAEQPFCGGVARHDLLAVEQQHRVIGMGHHRTVGAELAFRFDGSVAWRTYVHAVFPGESLLGSATPRCGRPHMS